MSGYTGYGVESRKEIFPQGLRLRVREPQHVNPAHIYTAAHKHKANETHTDHNVAIMSLQAVNLSPESTQGQRGRSDARG